MSLKRCTAIKSLLLMILLGTTAWVQAAPVAGTVLHVSGPLFVKKADGGIRVLGVQSMVEAGDTLSTQGNGYAQIRFSDDSLLTLQPETVLTLDKYAYDASVPAADQFVMTLQQGGLRSQAGKLGQRSKDRVTLVTPAARIGLQAATAVVQYFPADAPVADVAPRPSDGLAIMAAGLEASALQSDSPATAFAAAVASDYAWRLSRAAHWLESWVLGNNSTVATNFSPIFAEPNEGPTPPTATPLMAPGLYVAVTDGQIILANKGGLVSFSAGQFGYVANGSILPPVMLPANPAIQFTPPPAFSALPTPPGGTPAKSGAVDCEVR